MTKVLVAEDSRTQAEALREVLEEGGFEVDVVSDGDSALARATAEKYDVVVSDIVMPGLSGYELCRQLKASPETHGVPVILMTSLSDPMDIVHGIECGADNFLTKPFDADYLVGRIRLMLGNRRLRAEGDVRVGMEFVFMGRRLRLSSDSEQILDLLLGTFEEVLRANRELETNRAALAAAKAQLERHAARVEGDYRASEQRFKSLVDSMEEIVFTVDNDGRYTGVYGRALERTGLRAADVIGKTAAEILGPSAAAPHLEANRRALAGESVAYEWVQPGSPPRQFQTSLSPWRGGSDEILGVVGVTREITEEKRLQGQLMVSDRMATIGSIAAGVGHEINNPLASVLANLEMAATTLREVQGSVRGEPHARDFAESLEALDDARLGADRVRDIVRDLKTLSRSDEREVAVVDVASVLDGAIRLAQCEIRHRATLRKSLAPVPPVQANPGRLSQVFLNLLVNAAHAVAEHGGARREIEVKTYLHPSGRVAIEVSDTGPGISPEHLPHVFDAFFTTKPVGVGTGLGLSICHRIVAAAGGTIEIDTEVGRGTSFRVLLPATDPIATTGLHAAPASARRHGRARILVVDDDEMVCRAITRALQPDHDVESTTEPRVALGRILAGEQFDLILCDLMMPGMTGLELHTELSRRNSVHAERMIFVTGGAFTPQLSAALEHCPIDRLDKPLDIEMLRTIAQRHAPMTSPPPSA